MGSIFDSAAHLRKSADMRLPNDRETIRMIKILRKEVIQPQVPLRLPCYDLVPIDRFAFGANLVWRLRALRSFVA